MLALLDARSVAWNAKPSDILWLFKQSGKLPFIPILEKHTERLFGKLNGKQFLPKPITKVWIIGMCYGHENEAWEKLTKMYRRTIPDVQLPCILLHIALTPIYESA